MGYKMLPLLCVNFEWAASVDTKCFPFTFLLLHFCSKEDGTYCMVSHDTIEKKITCAILSQSKHTLPMPLLASGQERMST